MGYLPAKSDKCLFLNAMIAERAAVLIWVDDFVKEDTWNEFLARLRKRFVIPNVGPLRTFLGMEIYYDRAAKLMHLSQANTIDTLLERAGLQDCNPVPVPCQSATVFTKKDCPSPPAARSVEYASLIALPTLPSS
jgi:hypothetical protein